MRTRAVQPFPWLTRRSIELATCPYRLLAATPTNIHVVFFMVGFAGRLPQTFCLVKPRRRCRKTATPPTQRLGFRCALARLFGIACRKQSLISNYGETRRASSGIDYRWGCNPVAVESMILFARICANRPCAAQLSLFAYSLPNRKTWSTPREKRGRPASVRGRSRPVPCVRHRPLWAACHTVSAALLGQGHGRPNVIGRWAQTGEESDFTRCYSKKELLVASTQQQHPFAWADLQHLHDFQRPVTGRNGPLSQQKPQCRHHGDNHERQRHQHAHQILQERRVLRSRQ